jgi:iron only hydrogenase large subunit-like protein
VTSAETVLIQKHSTEEFLKLLSPVGEDQQRNMVVVGISPQSIGSLTAYYKQLNELITFKRLQSLFTELGAALVLDLSIFNLLSL